MKEEMNRETSRRSFRKNGLAGRAIVSGISLLAVVAGALVFSLTGSTHSTRSPVFRARGWELMRIDGNRRGFHVEFTHSKHIIRTGDKGCSACHHLNKPLDGRTSCSECHRDMSGKTSIFDHGFHEGHFKKKGNCATCHTDRDSRATVKLCVDCHPHYTREQGYYFSARSYKDAMHGLCMSCHARQREKNKFQEMTGCGSCHSVQ